MRSGFLGAFELDYETPGGRLIRQGARVRITVLAWDGGQEDGGQEIVARVESAGVASG